MLRKLLIGGLLALIVAAPASAGSKALMPGVTYEKGVQFTPHGPVAIHVVRGPRPTGLYVAPPGALERGDPGHGTRDDDAEAALAERDDGRRQRRLLRLVGPAERRADARRSRRQPAVRRPLERGRHPGRGARRPQDRVLRHLAGPRPAPDAERPQPGPGPERDLALHLELRAGDAELRPGWSRRSSIRCRPRRRTPTSPGRCSRSPAPAARRFRAAAPCSSRAARLRPGWPRRRRPGRT